MKICFVGDVVASSGCRIVRNILPSFLQSNQIDICIVNAENSACGLGVTSKFCEDLHNMGVDAITLGNHSFSNKDFMRHAKNLSYVICPSNVSSSWNGNYSYVINKNNFKLGVINPMGQINMGISCDSPFTAADTLINKLKSEDKVDAIFVDFHAETSSEKQAMGYYLDGKANCVVGTHTHVQTADEKILPNGTAYISDAGMTGAYNSILGMDIDTSLDRLVNKLHVPYKAADGEAFMSGVIIDIEQNGKINSIRRFCEYE